MTKRFGTFTAADHISFQVGRGEIFGLLGPNGAGKSTTFKMLCGLLKPTGESAQVVGLDLNRPRRHGQGQPRLHGPEVLPLWRSSVRQNLEFFAGVYGLSSRPRDARSWAAGRRPRTGALTWGPTPATSRWASSSGWPWPAPCIHDPEVLFLDEPTSGVDPLTRREFWSHINAMVERGVTVLVTTHFLDEAEYCDRIALVYQGRVIASGSPDDLKDTARTEAIPEPTLEDAFIGLVEAFDAQRGAA